MLRKITIGIISPKFWVLTVIISPLSTCLKPNFLSPFSLLQFSQNKLFSSLDVLSRRLNIKWGSSGSVEIIWRTWIKRLKKVRYGPFDFYLVINPMKWWLVFRAAWFAQFSQSRLFDVSDPNRLDFGFPNIIFCQSLLKNTPNTFLLKTFFRESSKRRSERRFANKKQSTSALGWVQNSLKHFTN